MGLKSGLALTLLSMTFAVGSVWAQDQASKEQQRADIRNAAKEVLSDLYQKQPKAKQGIQKAAGYGVFRNFGMKILLAGGGRGKGIIVNNNTGDETFMRMVEVQAGFGMGVKKFDVVFVFENETVLAEFVESGWELGGQGTAAATSGDEGVEFAQAISVKPGIWMYQLTDKGLALELTGKGTKYYKDKDLN